MSGIVGIIHLDGKPVDEDQLWTMAHSMQRRGPDYQRAKVLGNVGLAFAALNTTPEALNETQPLTIDGHLWIVADARIDNRDELRRYFNAKSIDIGTQEGDAEYILRAYQIWGEDCPNHLLGDFAFAIWDDREQKLFCARDHFGIKPFVYYQSDQIFVCATEIRALLAHPQVPEIINEARIADYLVQQLEGRDKVITLYRDIYRLSPAHVFTLHDNDIQKRQYWKLEPFQTIHLASDEEYAEAFQEQLTQAVVCRMRVPSPEQVGSMLSGGLDSSSIVGVARQWLNDTAGLPLKTFSAMSDNGAQEEETWHSLAVIAQGGLQPFTLKPSQISDYATDLEYILHQNTNLFDNWMEIPQLMYIIAKRQGVKILLDGVGGNSVMALGPWYIGLLIRSGHWISAIREAIGFSNFYGENANGQKYDPIWKILVQESRRALIPQFLRKLKQVRMDKYYGDKRYKEAIDKTIINMQFAEQENVVDQLKKLAQSCNTNNVWKVAEKQAYWLNHAYITVGMERYDDVASAHSVEPRRPYLDKRLVEFFLALPLNQKMRHGWTKYVARNAMQGFLPDRVRWRKGSAQLSTEFIKARHTLEWQYIEKLVAHDLTLVSKYIDYKKFYSIFADFQKTGMLDIDISLWRTIILILWLKNRNGRHNEKETVSKKVLQ